MIKRIINWFKSATCMKCGQLTLKENCIYYPGWAGGDSDTGYECIVCAKISGLKAHHDNCNREHQRILQERKALGIK